jgi:Zn-dependent M16 (insulinase) family peptidase
MFDLLKRVVCDTDFDNPEAQDQIRKLIQASAEGAVDDIASSGHQYARSYAESGLTRNAWLRQQVSGLSQVKLVTALANRPISAGLGDVIEKLKMIQKTIVDGSVMRAAITCGSESVNDNRSSFGSFSSSLAQKHGAQSNPLHEDAEYRLSLGTQPAKHFCPFPFQVYYGALSLPTTSYQASAGATLQILAQLLTHKHLHHEIREKGGAYGGGAYANGLDGLFGFYSYRDPNPVNSMSIMRNAGQWAVNRMWSDRDLEEAKISVFQRVDAPRSVNEEGMSEFLSGVTEDMKQRRREELLDVTKDEVREAAQTYIVDGLAKQSERLVLLGEKKDWVDGSWQVKNWTQTASPAK